jgi:hypothetical protein
MIPDATHQTLRIEAYVREDMRGAADRIDDVLDRLDRLAEREVIGSFSVESWEAGATRPRSAVRATVGEFEDWAARDGCSLEPAVDRSADADRIDVPIVCIAVYGDDDELLAVYPHTDRRGAVRTVEDGLDAVARRRHR